MKKLGYNLVKIWIRTSLHLFFGKIKVSGLGHVPKDRPVLFLPNHQSALLDVLLIAVDCNRKPYFLTRSDIFKSKVLIAVFDFFQMIPIYRIRDGRDSLKNNNVIFERCAELLGQGEAILMFPEANHNLRRRVRPLSKGFTRILFAALEKHPDLDIRLVPVGLNYRNAEIFSDRVAIYFGENIALQDILLENDIPGSTQKIKDTVTTALKGLTTHIEDDSDYENIISWLDAQGVDYLNPQEVNSTISTYGGNDLRSKNGSKPTYVRNILKGVFVLFNFPVVLSWRLLVKPKVWEPEFMGTLRFAFALVIYPIYYIGMFILLTAISNAVLALAVVTSLFFFNWIYTRIG
ncbi:lysophospholipid acyltransferase family protein [Maribacter algicola]|uniref:Lysophospholipid acyltransferase family protein n=1 Tax=Meishania litoralis TaxID=3434685 RepID=A0ACC7LFT9_9FLAO